MAAGRAASPRLPASAAPSALTSIGSPRGVPVPCTATNATAAADMSAAEMTSRMSDVCEGPFGAVRPLDRPS
jgi:hypothetical protein